MFFIIFIKNHFKVKSFLISLPVIILILGTFILITKSEDVTSSKGVAHPLAMSPQDYCSFHKPKVFHSFMYYQCIVDHRSDKNCISSSLYGMHNITCHDVLYITMSSSYSNDALITAMGDIDEKTKVNPPMMIKIAILNVSVEIFNETAIEEEIDEFLTQRPWWKISHESGNHAIDKGMFMVVFERYPLAWRNFFDYLVGTQYMSEDKCEKTPILAGRMSGYHPGLMPVLDVFSSTKQRYSYSIFQFYWPLSNGFVSMSDCPNKLNKWDCAFLSMTNCTLPKYITECTTENCLSIQTKGTMWVTAVDKASIDGKFIENLEMNPEKGAKYPLEHHKYLSDDQRKPLDFKFILPNDQSLWRVESPNTFNAMFTYLFMARPNSLYRPKMRKLIKDMRTRSKPHFHYNTPCVAVHVRRGDRIKPGINMIEFCANVSYDHNVSNVIKRGCVDMNRPEILGKCPHPDSLQDYGCSTIPFEAVRLRHVVSKVHRLIHPIIYDILVFSDDPIFIHEQAEELKKTEPQWKIHTLKHPELPKGVNIEEFHKHSNEYQKVMQHVRLDAGTDSGVLFHSSFKAAQQCSAFIAHFGSGVASLFYNSMCIEHGGRYGVCPPAYDMRWGLE